MLCHIHHKCAMKLPAAAREFFETALQQVCHCEVDVIAGDANAAAYKYYKNQEDQDLYNSSVAFMHREMQREAKTGQPFENRLHIDYSQAADDHDCHFMAILLSWRKLVGPRIM